MRIDAHQHFWQLGRFDTSWLNQPLLEPIRRDFLPADLQPHLNACRIERSIFVQTQHDLEENRWVLQLARDNPFIAGVVGWIDLASPACEDQLAEFRADPRFVGVRHITQDEPDPNFIVRPDVLRGLEVLERHSVPFDLLFYVPHLPHALTVAMHCPNLPLVIDHLAKPRIRDGSLEDWEPHFRAAARMPNVFCKLSGMVTEADWQRWQPADLKPYVDVALECFGPERLMYGSDWPVCELAASYERTHQALDELLAGLSESERALIFGETAHRFYRLD
ncbi:MAG: amidohydrolase family protein [Planctomyces sp.]|nr:amidohydrolase family protein [Planctomyces sp.]